MPVKPDKRSRFDPRSAQFFRAAQFGQIDDEERLINDAAGAADQFDTGQRGAACRDQIINQQYLLPRQHLTGVEFDAVAAIFKLIVDPDFLTGQLAGLAQRHEGDAQRQRQGRAEDEAPRLKPCAASPASTPQLSGCSGAMGTCLHRC